MGKLQEFDITFANNKVVYSPGESISGTLKIRSGNSLQYKGETLEHFGENTTAWLSEAHRAPFCKTNF